MVSIYNIKLFKKFNNNNYRDLNRITTDLSKCNVGF